MELGIIILTLFHVLNCLFCYYYEKVILQLKFETLCLPHIMVFVYIFAVYISLECVCVYITIVEFCFINLRIVNYFIGFSNYALATQ